MKISNDCLTSVSEVVNKTLRVELWNIDTLYATLNLKSSLFIISSWIKLKEESGLNFEGCFSYMF